MAIKVNNDSDTNSEVFGGDANFNPSPSDSSNAYSNDSVEPVDETVSQDGGSDDFEAKTVTQHAGLSSEELNDPNSIKVTLSDPKTPVVVLYGPPSCGKTMMLVRMTRYLKKKGYTVSPDTNFRPTHDTNYRQLCENFDEMINSNNAARSTSNISFMLVKVLKNGKPVCQILEAPGEFYFNPDAPKRDYPAYVHEIIGSQNRKVWAIMVEPDWSDWAPRKNYVDRIARLTSMQASHDRTIFVYNKIDLTPYVRKQGQVDVKSAITQVEQLYPGIFASFINTNPITKWWRVYNCEFVPFMTGSYSQTMRGEQTYTESHESYADKLWKAILKQING